MEIIGDFSTSVRRAFKETDPDFGKYPGLVVCGTHSPENLPIESIIQKIKTVREMNLPYYGECFGHQIAAVEYARNVLGIKDATSEEFGKGTYVVKSRGGLKVGLYDGESYWNNYEVDLPNWTKGENMFTAQFHASYQSAIDKPHSLIKSFLEYAKTKMAV